MLSGNEKFRIPDQVMARKVGEELVLLNLNNEQYYGLDEVGTRMWEVLLKDPDFQTVLDTLQADFDVSLEELRNDLEELVNKLLSEGLLEIDTL